MKKTPADVCCVSALTVTGGAALVWPDHRAGAAGHGAGNEHTHLPSRLAVAVAAAVVPALALLEALAVGREALAGDRHGGGAGAGGGGRPTPSALC